MPSNIFSFKETPPKVAYLDPSFCINVIIKEAKFHKECSEYSEKLETYKTILLFSNLGLDEVWFVLLRFQAIDILNNKGIDEPEKKWFWFLKDNPEIVKELAKLVEEETVTLLEIPNLLFVEITEHQTLHALTFMKDFGLMPRDSIHASATKLSGAESIITTDKEFAKVNIINVYTCNPQSFLMK